MSNYKVRIEWLRIFSTFNLLIAINKNRLICLTCLPDQSIERTSMKVLWFAQQQDLGVVHMEEVQACPAEWDESSKDVALKPVFVELNGWK